MKKLIFLCCILAPNISIAANCEISKFEVETRSSGSVYLHGKVDGQPRNFIPIHVVGNEHITNRNLSVALAAQMSGRVLLARISNITQCSEYTNYGVISSLVVKN